ncbi:LVIS_2131 family protein [Levilactobacillus bambusae]|uniref:Uncharacterized protein n=1 Tax=Levilactobacillus bambusae TaxID=2024736 RepID=A0A2V1MZB8_9LACO|nr:LVIS_2131 family protein [Levilactobacillus bambusae]PWF99827.1 hypothetical protein DCM90_07135 [Levilactobacillus bambusae]
MKSAWNLVGMALWLILLIYLIWMIHNMRVRRLKLIVQERKSFSWRNLGISTVELIVFLVAAYGMGKTTFFQNPHDLNASQVTVTTTYHPLVVNTTSSGASYYVSVKNTTGSSPVQFYSYYTDGERYRIASPNATISSGKNAINISASRYQWDDKKVKENDKRHQRAWVGTVDTTYKKTWQNGIGLHAGRLADRFTLIRVPDKSFVRYRAGEATH